MGPCKPRLKGNQTREEIRNTVNACNYMLNHAFSDVCGPCKPCLKGNQTREEIRKTVNARTDYAPSHAFPDVCGPLATQPHNSRSRSPPNPTDMPSASYIPSLGLTPTSLARTAVNFNHDTAYTGIKCTRRSTARCAPVGHKPKAMPRRRYLAMPPCSGVRRLG